MDRETLRELRRRAEEIRQPLSKSDFNAKTELNRRERSLHELMKAPPSDDGRIAFLRAAQEYYDAKLACIPIAASSEDAHRLSRAAFGLGHDWRFSTPGYGSGGAWFFVRRAKLDGEGRPEAYDPFWITEAIDDPVEIDKMRNRDWGKATPAKPSFELERPFGTAEEALRRSCNECLREGFVIGYKELAHWVESHEDDYPYPQALYVLCLECPRLCLIGERQDDRPAKLHA